MKSASLQYKEDMKFPFRNRWLLNMYIGFIQEKFQMSAVGFPLFERSFLSNNFNDYLFSNTELKGNVATFEKNLMKADGTSMFINKDSVIENDYYGLISEGISDANGDINIELRFASKRGDRGLKGLSLTFMETYPTSFTIKALLGDSQVFTKDYVNDGFFFETKDVFGEKADTLILKINKMNKPFVRFRLKNVLFGVGVSFDNKDFLASGGSYKERFHPCSVELPSKDFSLTLDNIDEIYDIDKQNSLINLASIGQDITLNVSYEHSDGHIETLSGEKLELSRFDIDGNSLRLEAVDFLRNENTMVKIDNPSLFTPTTTLYDIALKVKESLQNENFTVVLDNALKDVPIKYTKIETSCKEAFMMIAGAARCIMEIDSKGLIIRRVSYAKANFTAESNDSVPYSNLTQLFNPDKGLDLASFEPNYTLANGVAIFPSNNPSNTVKTGYISKSISNEYGDYVNPPYFDIISDEVISTDYVLVRFKNVKVRDMTITTYFDNNLIDTLVLKSLDTDVVDISKLFKSFNKMRITINSVDKGYRRVYVDYVSFDKKIYDLNYDLCIEKPHMDLRENVRNIIVEYSYMVGEEMEKKEITVLCNDNGSDIVYSNPFITDAATAQSVGEWLREYYISQIFYDIPLVGDPTLEVNDIITVPNKYNDDILGDIESNEIEFKNGGIRGKIEVRRRNNGMVRTKNKLALY